MEEGETFALAYGILGNNVWRSVIPHKNGDVCLSLIINCLAHLRKSDEMVTLVRGLRERLMGHRFSLNMPWFPDSILQSVQEMKREGILGHGCEGLLNELSIFLKHYYCVIENDFYEEQLYLMTSLIKCESALRNWNTILVVMREKRQIWREDLSVTKVGRLVRLESSMLDAVSNPMNGLEYQLVNESLDFVKHLVAYLLNDGAYGEKYLVVSSPVGKFEDDPLVLIIKTCLVERQYEELLCYLLEYEKLLQNKYGDKVDLITNGILLFGQWVTCHIKERRITLTKLVELMQGLKIMTKNWMRIISNHSSLKKTWMDDYADLICKNCDSHIALN